MYGYDGLPMMPVAPPSPNYIPGLEEPQTPPVPQDENEHELVFIQPHDPNFVPEPIYPEYIPLEDEHILPVEEQPLPPIVSPTTESPGYVAKSDPEEYEDDETEDGSVDHPMDGGDDGDDDDGDSSGYDVDDEDEEEEEEEHLASADFAIVIPTDELVSPPKETEPIIPPPSTDTATTSLTTTTLDRGASDSRDSLSNDRHETTDGRHAGRVVSTTWAAEESWTARRGRMLSIRVFFLASIALDLLQIMAPVTRQGQNPPPPNTDTLPHHRTSKSIQAMIDQALLRNSTNGDGSQSSHRDNPRNGNEGVVSLTRWIKKMESVFNINGCAIENQFVANENKKIDKYISGLPDNIYGNVKSSQPRMLDETIELTNNLMDQKLCTPMRKGLITKERLMIRPETTMDINNNPSRSRMSPRSIIWGRERGNHMKDLCPSAQSANVITMARAPRRNSQKKWVFQMWSFKTFQERLPKAEEQEWGNKNAQGWVYAVGNAEKNGNAPINPDSNVVTGTFLLNSRYASILFDTSADRSFISTAFSSLVNIDPTPLGSSYDVELADGKIVRIDTIIRECTLNFLNHPFNVDLMLVELGSFDVIIGMDWLRRCHAVIVCDDKLVQILYGNETLTFRGNKSNNGRESRLTVISRSKAQEYMAKGCQIFLAQISAKKEEVKSKGKQLKDVPIV
nr:reverse transcriptase domain-containing protein [Tanacetum cinerariifolium]